MSKVIQPVLLYPIETLAYAAGIMDGEGYIGISVAYPGKNRTIKYPHHELHVKIKITDYPVIKWLQFTFGGFICDATNQPSRVGNRPAWTWGLGGLQAQYFLELIYPYLRIKQQQAALAIEFQAYHQKHRRTRWTTEEDTQEILERYETYRHQINSLHLFRKEWTGDDTLATLSFAPSELTTETLAYCSGLIDGEGCIFIQVRPPNGERGANKLRYPSYRLAVQVINANHAIIAWLQSTFGGHIQDRSTTPSTCANPKKRPYHMWYVSTKEAGQFLTLIEPFLKIKQPQAQLAIEFVASNHPYYDRTPEALKRKEEYRQQISSLNLSQREIMSVDEWLVS